MDKTQIIAYVFFLLISVGIAFIAIKYQEHSKEILAYKVKEEARAEGLLEIENYKKARQIVIDSIYKFEELGKQFAYDGITKHSLVTEEASKLTGLSEEEIFNIIKATCGLINSNKTL